jgi:hypothetical protein
MNFYLTAGKKIYYLDALNYIKDCPDKSWRLDDDVEEWLNMINLNQHVCSMYSKRGKNKIGTGMESYLILCYTKHAEIFVTKELPHSLRTLYQNERFCEFNSTITQAYLQNEDENVEAYLKYINDKEYWNVNHVRLQLLGGHPDKHKLFWIRLSELIQAFE